MLEQKLQTQKQTHEQTHEQTATFRMTLDDLKTLTGYIGDTFPEDSYDHARVKSQYKLTSQRLFIIDENTVSVIVTDHWDSSVTHAVRMSITDKAATNVGVHFRQLFFGKSLEVLITLLEAECETLSRNKRCPITVTFTTNGCDVPENTIAVTCNDQTFHTRQEDSVNMSMHQFFTQIERAFENMPDQIAMQDVSFSIPANTMNRVIKTISCIDNQCVITTSTNPSGTAITRIKANTFSDEYRFSWVGGRCDVIYTTETLYNIYILRNCMNILKNNDADVMINYSHNGHMFIESDLSHDRLKFTYQAMIANEKPVDEEAGRIR